MIAWVAINAYGDWYIAYRTSAYGVARGMLGAEILVQDPTNAAAEKAALAALDPEDVRIGSNRLRGWYRTGEPGLAGWVLVHGAGGNRSSNIQLALALHDEGYAVLSLELSYADGEPFGGGQREAKEIAEALQWLAEKTSHPRALLYGCSVGAFNVLVAAAEQAPAAAVVAEGGFPSFPRMSAQRGGLPEPVFVLMPVIYPVFSHGNQLVDLSQIVSPAGLGMPSLVIAGTADREVDPSNGPVLAALTKGWFWSAANVGHCQALEEEKVEFLRRLNDLASSVGDSPRS